MKGKHSMALAFLSLEPMPRDHMYSQARLASIAAGSCRCYNKANVGLVRTLPLANSADELPDISDEGT